MTIEILRPAALKPVNSGTVIRLVVIRVEILRLEFGANGVGFIVVCVAATDNGGTLGYKRTHECNL